MFCSVLSAAIAGVDALPVAVEVDVSDGMPCFAMVGYVSSQVKEAQDRVRTALKNLGISLPPKRITVNLAPGDLRKEGTRFDLPIAAGILEATDQIAGETLADTMLIGELHLDGTIGRINGILPSVITARQSGCKVCLIPMENLEEGQQVRGIKVIGLRHLAELVSYSKGEYQMPHARKARKTGTESYSVDFRDIHGQEAVKRAALISAAGFHNLLLSGPPGSGKSMTAERMSTILPDMTEEEQLEISKIYSIVGLLPEQSPLLTRRPFRAPHHTITASALCGGGYSPRPGELTLAHRGVLFLDELPEMNAATIEMLRQPLESREITISRMGGTMTFPASFLLVAAMNPCPCGYYMSPHHRCSCSYRAIQAYQSRVSQAILDRIDLRCEVPATSYVDLNAERSSACSSADLKRQVAAAVGIQKERYRKTGVLFNSELKSAQIERYCPMTEEAHRLLAQAFEKLGLSARGYHHIIKVARTIADLDGAELICEAHVSESLCFRCRDGKPEEAIPGMEQS